MHGQELRDGALPLAAAGWLETHTSVKPAPSRCAQRRLPPAMRRTCSSVSGDSAAPETGVRHELVEDAVAVEEHSDSHGAAVVASDSQ